MEKYDAIIVGAGTAGCLAAITMASAGLKTLIVEIKSRQEIGNKVCGDAIGEIDFKALGLQRPTKDVLKNSIKGVKIYSPDEETFFKIEAAEFKGYMLDRHLFGQWLLDIAVERGATLMDSTLFLEPVIEGGFVTGIRCKNTEGELIQLESKVLVDASGFFAAVRSKLPVEMGIEQRLADEDIEVCYREVRQLMQEPDDLDYCKIYLNQEKTPGGYTWIFPTDKLHTNAGLGVYMHGSHPNPKKLFYEHTLQRQLFEGSTPVKMGGGLDPTRRPIDKLVGNGVVLIGDAASLVNPISGGGIGSSMKSGFYAGQAIIGALKEGDASQEALWGYARVYMSSDGMKQAKLDIFRRFLIGTDDADLNFGMKYRILTEEDIFMAGENEGFSMTLQDTARRMFRGISRLGLLNRLRVTAGIMKRVNAHYEAYPETPEGFEEWQKETVSLIDQARLKLQLR